MDDLAAQGWILHTFQATPDPQARKDMFYVIMVFQTTN
jgi:hypothetical protein